MGENMKTIGLIGGLSWESSIEYYRIINETVKAKLGGLHSAECLMFSFDFAEIESLQASGDWEAATHRMINAGRQLERLPHTSRPGSADVHGLRGAPLDAAG